MKSSGKSSDRACPDMLTTPSEFFRDGVNNALAYCGLRASPQVSVYLVHLLEHFLVTDNLYVTDEKGRRGRETLAEMYLRATALLEGQQRIDLLRKTGDISLYISGFFGDSLQRKLVDLDYYAGMGEVAYRTLLGMARDDDPLQEVYGEFAERFTRYVDVLTYLSQRSFIQSNQSLLRIYERYLRTGSDLARDQLIEAGLLAAVGATATPKQ